MHRKKLSIRQILTLVALFILCVLLFLEAYRQAMFFVRVVVNETLGWRAAAGIFFRFVLVFILALGAGTGPFVFAYHRIFPSRKE
jgi:hypothetical protein